MCGLCSLISSSLHWTAPCRSDMAIRTWMVKHILHRTRPLRMICKARPARGLACRLRRTLSVPSASSSTFSFCLKSCGHTAWTGPPSKERLKHSRCTCVGGLRKSSLFALRVTPGTWGLKSTPNLTSRRSFRSWTLGCGRGSPHCAKRRGHLA